MFKKLSNRAKKSISSLMKNIPDLLVDVPRITMIGQLHIYIENHQGLISFTKEKCLLRFKDGRLLISGDNFVIKAISAAEVILEGEITDVKFIKT